MDELISIIIPVYNGENTIENTLNNVFEQTYQNIEVLAINDGSIDNTSNILKRLQKADKRLKIFEQKNVGVSIARNKGIEKAKGKYICFVDADDRIAKDMIDKMYSSAVQYDSELVICGFCVKIGERKIEYSYGVSTFYTVDQIHLNFNTIVKKRMINVVWNKLIKRDFLIKNAVRFEPFSSGEDTIFNVRMFEGVTKVVFLKDILYYYSQSSNGTLTTKFHKDKFKALLKYNVDLRRLYNKWDLKTEDTEKELDFMLFRSVLSSYMSLANSKTELSLSERLKWIKTVFTSKEVQKLAIQYDPPKASFRGILFILRSQNSILNYLVAKALFLLNKSAPALIERGKTNE